MRANTLRTRLWLGVGLAAVVATVATSAYGASASGTKTTLGVGAAATVNPKVLVLRQADVPAGYRFGEAAVISNQMAHPDLASKFGRITGYGVAYVRQESLLRSIAEVFRTPQGAHLYFGGALKKLDGKTCAAGQYEYYSRVRRVSVGSEGWIYRHKDCGRSGPSGTSYYAVFWRHDRIVAGVDSFREVNTLGAKGLSITQTVALAKLQQRRIVAAAR